MRRLHLVVYSIVLLLTFCSCQQEGGQEGLEFDCTTSNVEDWGKHINIEECLPLEYPDSLGLGDAYKCVFGGGRMVYWDYSRKELYSYATDGRFLGKIGAEGHSKSEYIGIKDIFLDKDGERSYVSPILHISILPIIFFRIPTTFCPKLSYNRQLGIKNPFIHLDNYLILQKRKRQNCMKAKIFFRVLLMKLVSMA